MIFGSERQRTMWSDEEEPVLALGRPREVESTPTKACSIINQRLKRNSGAASGGRSWEELEEAKKEAGNTLSSGISNPKLLRARRRPWRREEGTGGKGNGSICHGGGSGGCTWREPGEGDRKEEGVTASSPSCCWCCQCCYRGEFLPMRATFSAWPRASRVMHVASEGHVGHAGNPI